MIEGFMVEKSGVEKFTVKKNPELKIWVEMSFNLFKTIGGAFLR